MLIKREKYLSIIRNYYDVDLIKVLTGVRRAGKSIILEQIKEEIFNSGVDENHIIFINFEDISFEKIRNYIKLNNYIVNKIKDKNKYYIFLDEIQHVNQYEKVLNSLRATKNVSIFVTGSNSKLLSGKLASILVGRCVEFRIFPFSYSEVLEYYKLNNITPPKDPFEDYLLYGGMPLRFNFNNSRDIRKYLKTVYDGIVDKDICTSKSKVNKEKFLIVANYILSNVGKRFSASNIAEAFKELNDSELTRATIYRYLNLLEKACLISRVKRYDVSSKRSMKMVEKHYVVDPGFKTIMVANDSESLAGNLENAIYNELVIRDYDVYIGKTYKGEIDFVTVKDRKKKFIQVSYLMYTKEVEDREFNAFSSIKDASPKYVMSLDRFDMSKNGIIHINAEQFLKGEVDL